MLRNTTDYNPIYGGPLRVLDENKPKRESLIVDALNMYGFYVQTWEVFRLDYLGGLIRQHTDQNEPRNKLFADVLILNGDSYSPLQKLPTGGFRFI
ncbi:hypothetical protein [Spirosoma fluviale]|uniref:Uncharacterized protein n=1 Tax=Spirosoma fluviale TaxID=1597977 RepID=A0A286FCC0_9BACT|nr:hypothetical protein [Spirosoma fluviale]SOD80852.1 hypothetical protein SAMN06269250_1588 [Spirosoma fluviale]